MSQQPDPFGFVGATLGGKYTVERVVARTEFSVVYRANHRIWQRPVAIKAFSAPLVAEGARAPLLEGFVREGMLLMDLSERCASICQARDVGSAITSSGDWVPYMVLEWLEGESLEAMLARDRAVCAPPRTVAEAVQLLDPIAQALTLAHERRIVHLDVKPGNILLLSDGGSDESRSKVVDFGIAQIGDSAGPTSSCEVAALKSFTPAYGAPEQFDPQIGRPGTWTDVFALALVFVEVVSGQEPLHGASLPELAKRACDETIRPTPLASGVAVSPTVERVLSRALAVRPTDRFANAGDFWFALTRAARGRRAISGEPLAPSATSAPWGQGISLVEASGAIPIALLRRRARGKATRPIARVMAIAAVMVMVGVMVSWVALERASQRLQTFQPLDSDVQATPSSTTGRPLPRRRPSLSLGAGFLVSIRQMARAGGALPWIERGGLGIEPGGPERSSGNHRP
ncbi:MAG: serine/threonine-protein kinase [Polyangiaceae bacterium]|jgi:serine/threonine protein kinase